MGRAEIGDQRVGAATRKWVEQYIDGTVEGIAGAEREIHVEERAAIRREIEDRAAKSESALTELLMDMERRLAALEQQQRSVPAARPRLVAGGGNDAA